MADRTPAQMIRDGYATPGPEAVRRADRRRRDLASTYREHPYYERLLTLKVTDPATFERVTTPNDRIALGSYAVARQARKEADDADNR